MSYPLLYGSYTNSPADILESGNGLGALSDCLECKISETLNGEYFLSMAYPLGGIHSTQIEEGCLIRALRRPGDFDSDAQVFRVTDIDIDYFSKEMQITAQHISRDLKAIPAPIFRQHGKYDDTTLYNTRALTETYFTYTPQSVIDYFQTWIEERLGLSTSFSFTNSGNFPEYDPMVSYGLRDMVINHCENLLDTVLYMTEMYQNTENAIELEFDNWQVKFWRKRGKEKDVSIRYGKNLTAFSTKKTGGANAFAVVPYIHWDETISENAVSDSLQVGELQPGAFYDATDPTRNAFVFVDFTNEMEGVPTTDLHLSEYRYQRTMEAIKTAADTWNEENDRALMEQLAVTIDFEYLDLAKASTGFDNPFSDETADVGDYVTIHFDQANIDSNIEIVSVEFDVLKERYSKVTAGQLRKTLSQTIEQIANK